MKKAIATIIILGVLTAIGWWGVHALKTLSQADSGPPKVRSEAARRGELVEIVSAPGQIEPRTKVQISSRVAARIEALPFKEGARVTAGDPARGIPASVLVRLDSTELDSNLKQAEASKSAQEAGIQVAEERLASERAQMDATRATLTDAERDLARKRDLLKTKDVAQQDVDLAETKVATIKAQLASAEYSLRADDSNLTVLRYHLQGAVAEVSKAREALNYTTITSPIDGIVTRINAKVGEVVIPGTMNNAGTVVLEVADLSQMLMVARVDETSIARVNPGQTATVRIQAYPDETFDGTVETVALSYTDDKDGSKYFKSEILLKDKGKRVLAGLTADADIETERHKDVICVPSQAVVGRHLEDLPPELRKAPEVDSTKAMVTVVFRVADGKVHIAPVSIGPSDDTRTIIKSGLHQGDRVVVGPFKVLETLKDQQVIVDDQPTTQPSTRASSASAPATLPASGD